MPVNVPVNYTPLTDPFIWFANVAAFNAWAGALSVSISSSSVPAATTTENGVVKQTTVLTYTPAVITQTYFTLNTDEGSVDLASKQYVDDLNTKVTDLATTVQSLITLMKAAGQMALV